MYDTCTVGPGAAIPHTCIVDTQADGVTSDSRDWCPGDVIERVWTLPVPSDLAAGTYRLATGIYSIPDVTRVPLSEPQGDLLDVATLTK